MIFIVKAHIWAGSYKYVKIGLNVYVFKIISHNITIMNKNIFAYLNQLINKRFYGICTQIEVFVM